jgi:hypothetical protein
MNAERGSENAEQQGKTVPRSEFPLPRFSYGSCQISIRFPLKIGTSTRFRFPS